MNFCDVDEKDLIRTQPENNIFISTSMGRIGKLYTTGE